MTDAEARLSNQLAEISELREYVRQLTRERDAVRGVLADTPENRATVSSAWGGPTGVLRALAQKAGLE